MRGLTLQRHIPEGSIEKVFEDVKLKIYTYINFNNKPCAIAYKGKSNKPLWSYYFKNEENRENRIQETYKSLLLSLKYQEERKEERKKRSIEFKENLEVGTILYDTFGYSMTLVEFWQVTNIKGSTVTIQEIGSNVEETGYGQGYARPIKDSFLIGESRNSITKRVTSDSIKLNDSIKLTIFKKEKVWTSWMD